MLSFLLFCLFCYFLFVLGSILFPIFLVIGAFSLVLYGLKALFNAFTPRPDFHRKDNIQVIYMNRSPNGLLTAIWQGVMRVLYQIVFTITKAIQDGKNH